MRVVIVGGGDIGRELAGNLARRGNNELIIIDTDEKRCEQLAGELDVLVLRGDGTHPDMLKEARLAEADALVATTGSDAINTVIAMLGHRFGVQQMIVKLNDVGLRAACQEIGVSQIIAPKIAAAAEILAALYGSERLDLSLVVRGGLRLVELEITEARGKRLAELEIPDGALAVAVLRDEQALLPRAKIKLQEGDILLTLIENDAALEKLKKVLTPVG
jgi:trk system potassium uptake protein TrkA